MSFVSINPATGRRLATFDHWSEGQLEQALARAHRSAGEWAATPVAERCEAVRAVGQLLRERRDVLAEIITLEMGKLIGEARAEVEKCASACDYYADHGPGFMADDFMASDAGRSFLAYEPLGPVLAVMPWNFPFWQVLRFAAPALVGGNVALLKHASNVPQCALALQDVFRDAGLRDGVFTSLMIGSDGVKAVIEDRRVRAVTLTGSEAAGRAVAAIAGAQLKKTVLELGGSDPFVVCADADLGLATEVGLQSRLINAGQSCIAAKRFIVVESVADAFVESLVSSVGRYRCGNPLHETTTLAPLARKDLRDELHDQVRRTIEQGARPVIGCAPEDGEGVYYPVSILDGVRPNMTAAREELFGPVIPIIRVRDEAEAVRIANDTAFGLGGSVWTADVGRGERIARQIQAGAVFVNGLVKSDPRLPFGGIKDSGYGRELSYLGLHEFLNIKTVWIR